MKLTVGAFSVVLVTFVVGCADEDFVPLAGEWYRTVNAPDINTCGDGGGNPYQDSFTLSNREGGFTILREDNEEEDSCTLNGMDFTCTYHWEAPITGISDATGIYEVEWKGSFLSETELSGESVFTTDCTGTGCAVIGWDFPCLNRRVFIAETL